MKSQKRADTQPHARASVIRPIMNGAVRGHGPSGLRTARNFAAVWIACMIWLGLLAGVRAVEIKLPPETGVFQQDAGAEIANGRCLSCHSVEYVSTQPPMVRAYWQSAVQKMRQKYGAQIPDEQVETLID